MGFRRPLVAASQIISAHARVESEAKSFGSGFDQSLPWDPATLVTNDAYTIEDDVDPHTLLKLPISGVYLVHVEISWPFDLETSGVGMRRVNLEKDGGGRVESAFSPGSVLTDSLSLLAGRSTWANQPAAVTEVLGNANNRKRVLMRGGTVWARFTGEVFVAGAAGAYLQPQVSSNGTSWSDFGSAAQRLPLDVVGLFASPWARTSVFTREVIRVIGADGDGIADPEFGNLALEIQGQFGSSIRQTAVFIKDASAGENFNLSLYQTAQATIDLPAGAVVLNAYHIGR